MPNTGHTMGGDLAQAPSAAERLKAILGGSAALWFKSAGAEGGFCLYAAGMTAVGLLVALAMRDTRTHGRIDPGEGRAVPDRRIATAGPAAAGTT